MQQVPGGVLHVDRQCLEAVLRRGKRSGLCSSDLPAIAELVNCADDVLFNKVLDTFCTIRCQMKQSLLMHLDADLTIENWSIKLVVLLNLVLL